MHCILTLLFCCFLVLSASATDEDETATVEDDIGKSRDASRTDDEVVERYNSWDKFYCRTITDQQFAVN